MDRMASQKPRAPAAREQRGEEAAASSLHRPWVAAAAQSTAGTFSFLACLLSSTNETLRRNLRESVLQQCLNSASCFPILSRPCTSTKRKAAASSCDDRSKRTVVRESFLAWHFVI